MSAALPTSEVTSSTSKTKNSGSDDVEMKDSVAADNSTATIPFLLEHTLATATGPLIIMHSVNNADILKWAFSETDPPLKTFSATLPLYPTNPNTGDDTGILDAFRAYIDQGFRPHLTSGNAWLCGPRALSKSISSLRNDQEEQCMAYIMKIFQGEAYITAKEAKQAAFKDHCDLNHVDNLSFNQLALILDLLAEDTGIQIRLGVNDVQANALYWGRRNPENPEGDHNYTIFIRNVNRNHWEGYALLGAYPVKEKAAPKGGNDDWDFMPPMEIDPFITVRRDRYDLAVQAFRGTDRYYARIEIPTPQVQDSEDKTKHYLPEDASRDWDTASLRVSVPGGNVKRRLRLEIVAGPHKKTDPLHTAYLDFYPTGSTDFPNHILNFMVTYTQDETEAEDGGWYGYFDITFDTLGGIGCGLCTRKPQMDTLTIELLDYLHLLTTTHISKTGDQKPRHVHLRLRIKPHHRNEKGEDVFTDELRDDEALPRDSIIEKQDEPDQLDPKAPPPLFNSEKRTNEFHDALEKIKKDSENKDKAALHHQAYRFDSGEVGLQMGQFITRESIDEEAPLVKYPAVNSFVDKSEAAVALGYSCWLNHLVGVDQLQQLCDEEDAHKVGFLHVENEVILATIKLGVITTRDGEAFRIDHGTFFGLSWKAKGMSNEGRALASVIENTYGIEDCDLLLLVYGNKKKFLEPHDGIILAVPWRLTPRMHTLNLRVKANNADISRQISGLNKLCVARDHEIPDNPTMNKRWTPLVLNQDLIQERDETIHELLGIPMEKIANARRVVSKFKKWNEQQQAFIDEADVFRARVKILVGLPGCGKTTVIAACTIFYYLIGLHVLISAPSNAATDQSFHDLLQFVEQFPDDVDGLDPMRLYRSADEAATTRKTPADQVDSFGAGDEILVHEDIVDAQDRAMIISLKIAQGARFDSLQYKDTHSAEAKTRIRAQQYNKEDVLWMAYPSTNTESTDGDKPMEGVPEKLFDMWSELRRYLDYMKQEPFFKWTVEDKRMFGFCLKRCRDEVVKACRCATTTHSTVGAEYLRQYFGTGAIGIIVIQDESGMTSEPYSWIWMKLAHASLVTGMIVVGDPYQLLPVVKSEFSNKVEHVEQLCLPLMNRLLAEGVPSTTLREQHRMHPDISAFPGKKVYGGMGGFINGPDTYERESCRLWDEHLNAWFGERQSKEWTRVVIDVPDGVAVLEPMTKSKYNEQNITVVIDLILQYKSVCNSAGADLSNIVIMTAYREQLRRYISRLLKMAEIFNFEMGKMPKVRTVDSMQGSEADIIIYDTVVTQDIGFLDDSHRFNVAVTRPRRAFVMVGFTQLVSDEKFQKKWKHVKRDATGINRHNPLPLLIQYFNHMQSIKRVRVKYAKPVEATTLQPNEEAGYEASTTTGKDPTNNDEKASGEQVTKDNGGEGIAGSGTGGSGIDDNGIGGSGLGGWQLSNSFETPGEWSKEEAKGDDNEERKAGAGEQSKDGVTW